MFVAQLTVENFNRVCEQLVKVGERNHEHLRIIKRYSDAPWELTTTSKPQGFARFISWFYKPQECRFANVSKFALEFLRKNKDRLENNPKAFEALERLSILWENKPCSTPFKSLVKQIRTAKEQATNKVKEELIHKVMDAERKAKVILEKAQLQQSIANYQVDETRKKITAMFEEESKQKKLRLEEFIKEHDKAKAELEKTVKELEKVKEKEKEILFKARQAFNELPIVKTDELDESQYQDVDKDCMIKCTDGHLKVHWHRLKHVPYFKDTLNPVFQQPDKKVAAASLEEDEKSIKHSFDLSQIAKGVNGFDVRTVSALNEFVYFKHASITSLSGLLELYRLADFLKFEALKSYGHERMLANIYENPSILFEVLPEAINSNHPACEPLIKIFIIFMSEWTWSTLYEDEVPTKAKLALFTVLHEKFEKRPEPAIDTALGVCYFHGIGVTQNREKANSLFESRSKEYVHALTYQGIYYDSYNNPNKDFKKANDFFVAAAARGCIIAQFCSTQNVYEGRAGVAQNKPVAFQLFKELAKQGYGPAQTMLGVCYELGYGTNRNREEAVVCYILAAKKNINLALNKLKELGYTLAL